MNSPVIMWFRQDLRLSDHAALSAAAAAGPVIPLFILDDETPGEWRWGGASRWWLHKSLEKLNAKLSLVLRRGRADQVLEQVIAETGASAVYFTRDYAPWSTKLEHHVKETCDKRGVACHRHGGFLLHEPEHIKNGSGSFFKVYTPFSRACFTAGVTRAARPVAKVDRWTGEVKSDSLADWNLLPTKPNWATGFEPLWQPGEAGAQKRLHDFLDEGLKGYADGRDVPSAPHFSRLSPHLHWGEISPLQVWQVASQKIAASEGVLDRDGEKFLKEVLWREFSYHLLFNVPELPTKPFRPEFADFPWGDDQAAITTWQRGQTGYPIVDAGMRELWATGFMHNRVRMIVASFLIKHLLVPWQQGEAWFWDTLVDADIASNAASWQWVAGCGADAAPYFRIFNPFLQGEKFDGQGEYVRKWVPELKDVPNEFLHMPWTLPQPPKTYPQPMVDHGVARERALQAFKELRNGAPI
jgi:deoxyribodipyrimidine photo-lyase